MTQFMVEIYLTRGDLEAVGGAAARADAAVTALAASGAPIRHVRSIYVPEDETCFLLFEADSEDSVRAAARLADLICNRVVEAHPLSGVPRGDGDSVGLPVPDAARQTAHDRTKRPKGAR